MYRFVYRAVLVSASLSQVLGVADDDCANDSFALLQESKLHHRVMSPRVADFVAEVADTVAEVADPVLSPSCADIGSSAFELVDGACPAWVVNGEHCGKEWADAACEATCSICTLCELGDWGEWSECSSTCGGGGQVRIRATGDCGDEFEYSESQQCNTDNCEQGDCTLTQSEPLVIITDNEVVENVEIITDGLAPAIFVYGASNVILRNIKIVHTGHSRFRGNLDNDPLLGNMWVDQSGAGIFFQNSPNIQIENVHVSLARPTPNPYASEGVCAEQYCGPFPADLAYAYNIYGEDSENPILSNVYVTGGSTGFWCKDCPHGTVSHFKAENMHGPYPRGQCFQVVSSNHFTLEDFACIQDNEIAFPEDDVSVWNSSHALVQRGYIQGNNAPNGVGVMFEMSDHALCQDVDVTLLGGTTFSAYGAHDVTFLRTRARDNHIDGGCLAGHGYCQDPNGNWPNSLYDGDETVPDPTCCGDDVTSLKRCDTAGGIWFAGDYTEGQAHGEFDFQASEVSVRQGVFYDMTTIESEDSYSNVGECVTIDMAYWATSAANRQEAYTVKDFAMEDFTLRTPFSPTFCFSTA